MHKNFYLLIFVVTFSVGNAFAQEILPEFALKNLNGKIVISWLNNYPGSVKGISIQRSSDSIKKFSTLASVPNPKLLINGFVDKNPPGNNMFYRLFIVFDSGVYIYTGSQKVEGSALPETAEPEGSSVKKPESSRKDTKSKVTPEKKAPARESKNTTVNRGLGKLKNKEKTALLPKEETYTYPSKRVYTGKDNNIVINLPGVKTNKYIIRFFDDENKPLFELTKITEDYLIIEKMNFLHSGWFKFEIYENDKLLEKNKFNIPRDGKNQ